MKTIQSPEGVALLIFVIPNTDGHLTISEVIRWQDDTCANTYLNIFSLHGADDNEILTSIHNYSNPVS